MMETIKRITDKFDKDGKLIERITEEMAEPSGRIDVQPIYVPIQPYYPYIPNVYPNWTYTNGTVTISDSDDYEIFTGHIPVASEVYVYQGASA
jgi:hypothetical protein